MSAPTHNQGQIDSPKAQPTVFVAVKRSEVPPHVHSYASVDGSVPGASFHWDHHHSGELVNLDAVPDHVDVSALDGVCSTHADTDSVLSAVVVLLGGRAALAPDVRAAFEAASHYCDHLGPHPAHSADVNARGRRLHAAIMHALHEVEGRSTRFAREVKALFDLVGRGAPLPERDPEADLDPTLTQRLHDEGRIERIGDVALVDLNGIAHADTLTVYRAHGAPIGITYSRHRDGGTVYSVGTNPLVPAQRTRDLRPLLRLVAAREHSHGGPCTSPGPGENNWGGRAEVFGSPWGYGSRIGPRELATLAATWLAETSTTSPATAPRK